MTCRGAVALFLLMSLMTATGCADTPAQPAMTMTPITDVKSVAGDWEGLLKGFSHKDDWATVVIGEDGSYEFKSYRPIGVFSGRGTLMPNNGQLIGTGPRGTTTWTLYTAGDQRRLKVVARDADVATASQASAELSPAKPKGK